MMTIAESICKTKSWPKSRVAMNFPISVNEQMFWMEETKLSWQKFVCFKRNFIGYVYGFLGNVY